MSLQNSFKKIKKFLLDKYKENLAGILIFGSANTGNFKEGTSDIDHMIFLKKQKKLDLKKEGRTLIKDLKSERLATQYFHTLKSIKTHLKTRKSFSTYITIIAKDGSKTLYTTPEFEKTKQELLKHPLTKKEIKKYLVRKDRVELYGYFKKTRGIKKTKALLSHLRRKIQILNYWKTNKLIFDFKKCLNNIELEKDEKNNLKELYKIYLKRGILSKKQVEYYSKLAEKFTEKILKA